MGTGARAGACQVSLPVVFRPEADAEFEEAQAWYEKRLRRLGQEFVTSVQATIKCPLSRKCSKRWPVSENHARRVHRSTCTRQRVDHHSHVIGDAQVATRRSVVAVNLAVVLRVRARAVEQLGALVDLPLADR
jgi:hypothetical protein